MAVQSNNWTIETLAGDDLSKGDSGGETQLEDGFLAGVMSDCEWQTVSHAAPPNKDKEAPEAQKSPNGEMGNLGKRSSSTFRSITSHCPPAWRNLVLQCWSTFTSKGGQHKICCICGIKNKQRCTIRCLSRHGSILWETRSGCVLCSKIRSTMSTWWLFLDALVNDHWSIWRAVATMTNSFTERPAGKLVTVTSSRIISGSLKHAASPGTKVFLQFVNRSLSAVAESSWRLKYSFGGSSSLRRCYQVGFQEDHQRSGQQQLQQLRLSEFFPLSNPKLNCCQCTSWLHPKKPWWDWNWKSCLWSISFQLSSYWLH